MSGPTRAMNMASAPVTQCRDLYLPCACWGLRSGFGPTGQRGQHERPECQVGKPHISYAKRWALGQAVPVERVSQTQKRRTRERERGGGGGGIMTTTY